jgi:hypothetical protein
MTTSWHFKRSVIEIFKPAMTHENKINVNRCEKRKDLDTKFFR